MTNADLVIPVLRDVSNRNRERSPRLLATSMLAIAILSIVVAGVFPIQLSIITVFLFAGPHNWFELRYFISRLPLRLGRSGRFFGVAFFGWAVLFVGFALIPILTYTRLWSTEWWLTSIAIWNTLFLLWTGALIWMRGRLRPRSNWSWVWPIVFAVIAVNWLAPQFVSLSFVFVHPLVAFWFLDRHLAKSKPEWLKTYRLMLMLLPLMLGVLWWRLASMPSLPEAGGVAWRITQHAGAAWMPNISSHLLVSTHVFLEILHYAAWILALPLIGRRLLPWDVKSIPLVRHRRGWPRLVRAVVIAGFCVVAALWLGFSVDYATTRDVYFTIAVGHVMAEVPFLLRMI